MSNDSVDDDTVLGAAAHCNCSAVDHLFAFQIVSGRVGYVHERLSLSVNVQPAYCLQLDVAATTVQSCLSRWSSLRVDVGGSDMIDRSRDTGQARTLLHRCPPYLIIQLTRATPTELQPQPVGVDRRLLLGDDVVIGNGADVIDYELCALCCHDVVLCQRDGIWYQMNDVTVTRLDDIDHTLRSAAVQQTVCLLLYRQT